MGSDLSQRTRMGEQKGQKKANREASIKKEAKYWKFANKTSRQEGRREGTGNGPGRIRENNPNTQRETTANIAEPEKGCIGERAHSKTIVIKNQAEELGGGEDIRAQEGKDGTGTLPSGNETVPRPARRGK